MNKILIGITFLFTITFAYFGIVYFIFPDAPLLIIILIYLFIILVLMAPFFSGKHEKVSFFTKIFNQLGKTMNEPEEFKFHIERPINLDVKYRQPLISKCKCGLVLTNHTKKCPKCGRLNSHFIPK